MKPRHPRRAGRKPIDHLGSIRALSKTLSAALTRLGVATPTPRQDIAAQFRRSKYFQKRCPSPAAPPPDAPTTLLEACLPISAHREEAP